MFFRKKSSPPQLIYLNDLFNKLIREEEAIIPCSLKEIESLEKSIGAKLPLAYKEFLLIMGKGASKYMMGSSMFWDDLEDINKWAPGLLAENNFKKLPENAFVFYMHQGYQFSFFILGESNNPTTYYYQEMQKEEDFRNDGPLAELLMFFSVMYDR